MTSDELLERLWQARTERAARRREWVAICTAASETYGECDRRRNSSDGYGDRCHDSRHLDRAQWCQRCSTPHDAWIAYRKASIAAAVALRKACSAGRKLSTATEPEPR